MDGWLNRLVAWAESLRLHQVMQSHEWAVPAMQSLHILALAVVFSSSLVLALRAVHVTGIEWSPARWGQRLNAWVVSGLVVMLITGAVLIIGEPGRSLLNWVFQTKMVLLVAALAVFFTLVYRLEHLDPPERATGVERGLSVLLVLLWLAIIACGRWIAYS